MRCRRKVTLQPIGMPSRSLKLATDFFARQTAGFWPLSLVSSFCALVSFFESATAFPTAMLTTIFSSRGTCRGSCS